MNFLNVTLEKLDEGALLKGDGFEVTLPAGKVTAAMDAYYGKEVIMGIRPENIYEDEAHIAAMPEAVVDAEVDLTEMMGAETYLYLKIAGIPVISRVNRRTTAKAGDMIKAVIDVNKVHLFDKETERAIIH